MSGFRKAAQDRNVSPKSKQSSPAASSTPSEPVGPKKAGISFSLGGPSSTNNNVEATKSAGNANGGKVSFAFGTKDNRSGATLKGHSHKRRRSPSPEQLITVFGADGATGEKEEDKKVLVIPAIENRNWIEETMKRRGIYKPVGQLIDAERNREADEQEKRSQQTQTYGLTLKGRDMSASGDKTVDFKVDEDTTAKSPDSVVGSSATNSLKYETKDETIRELISELSEEDRKKSDLVLPISLASTDMSVEARRQQMSEEEAYKLDILTRPDEPTLQDYEAVPVEEFGFALLRGMGWKEGEDIGRNRKRIQT
ncbi:DExH-box splicing factor binding site-domain-containing protein [Lipomyces kononenkoae]|uniref:DExH-box splicing factor binding site-domain-containing protein n=1 Tax=Lipomyces kononenkoae TaxID=34357 RepID=A0ACC3T011_LIPKO